MGPGQVRSKLDRTGVVVGIRGTDTHGLDLLDAAYLVDDHLQSLHTGIHIILYFVIAARLDGCCCLDLTTGIHDAENGVRSS